MGPQAPACKMERWTYELIARARWPPRLHVSAKVLRIRARLRRNPSRARRLRPRRVRGLLLLAGRGRPGPRRCAGRSYDVVATTAPRPGLFLYLRRGGQAPPPTAKAYPWFRDGVGAA